ncbi:AraC family transcriptional regulator [Thalassovita mediterranea]|jgi:AraC family transcriptional regulator|uniref:Regulatory protein SoxS n=1 Tax=Thalassovita mediterranea TaxID=340021 RepID=A0A0P1GMT3_9RHOB|nr:AraC family transcriptional regulator [Thalassovita mediterranea]CUH83527.1 Regulatory protein SoxS [Thalassovita mediterranea]SIS34468.1 transcriptional regulator, AraC family [Thalassovita mediterranea]
MSQNYEDRIRRVVRYIHENPAGDLSLDRLADVAAMSRFHWHRVFHAMMGETCADMVRRVRLHQASLMLARGELPVAEVARQVGYPTPQSFGRAFRAAYGVTPLTFRKQGVPLVALRQMKPEEFRMFEVVIEERKEARFAGLSHEGSYNGIGAKFEELAALATTRGLWPQMQGMVGIYCHDPSETPEADLRSYAALILGPDADVPEGLEAQTYPAGRVAKLTYKGPYSNMSEAYHYLYGRWLPESGEEAADLAPFEVYLNSPIDTAAEDLLTEVCVVLK